MSSITSAHPFHHFSLAEIQLATNDFDDKLIIGRGGFGKVYKGVVSIEETSHVVAIKQLDTMSNQGAPEFWAEIKMLTKLRHCHLVSLIGFCDDNKEMVLVYEYMPHGTLYDHLHKAVTPLNWVQRLKMSIGAARGLDYLHTGVGTKHGVIHRDVKSSNILLDDNWDAMISDFGLSKISPTNQSSSYVDTSVKGTFGYLDPEYFYTRRLTRKTDVYAYGVVLLEILSGRLPVDIRYGEEQCSLVRWAQKCVRERKIDQMVDPYIRGTILPKCLRQFAQLAYRCLLSVPKERPTMAEVVVSLQLSLALQEKWDNSGKPSGMMGLAWKMQNYFVLSAEGYSDQSGRHSTDKDGGDHGEMPHQHGELLDTDLKRFTYEELKCATRDFRNDTCLGKGVLGEVYKGWVDELTSSPSMHDTGLPIAIKKLRSYKHFDLEMLKKFQHPNLVKLIGYCLEGEQLFLAHEFMHKGSLENLLHSRTIAQLPLVTKVKIALGIARGIVFLHQTQHKTVIESQLDRNKILLSEDFTAKLADYDVTKLVHGHYTDCYDKNDRGYYYPGCEPLLLHSNLSGFTVVFAEVLTGERIFVSTQKQKIDNLFSELGNKSLDSLAELCYKICNEVDSEPKMITMLEDYNMWIRLRLSSLWFDPLRKC